MRAPVAAAVGVIALVLASMTSAASQPFPKHRWSERAVVRALHLQRSDDGIGYTMPSGCDIAVILNTRSEVALYADAGDVVASNPDRSAGVKIVGSHRRSCHREATQKLRVLS